MILYRPIRKRSLAWLAALVIFLIAMCLSFADVYGAAYNNYNPPRNSNEYNIQDLHDGTMIYDMNIAGGNEISSTLNIETEVPAVPEPATLTLLGLGVGALLLRRKFKK